MALIEQRAEQAFEIRAYRYGDGAWRVSVEAHDEPVQLLDAVLDHRIIG
ncbi:MAG: hypothetical protein ACREU3_02950 [Steroidobacteraceae bacterium]